jgi:hypothetical protein
MVWPLVLVWIPSEGLDRKWPVLPVSAISEVSEAEHGRGEEQGGESKRVWDNRDLDVTATRGIDSRVCQLVFVVGWNISRTGGFDVDTCFISFTMDDVAAAEHVVSSGFTSRTGRRKCSGSTDMVAVGAVSVAPAVVVHIRRSWRGNDY